MRFALSLLLLTSCSAGVNATAAAKDGPTATPPFTVAATPAPALHPSLPRAARSRPSLPRRREGDNRLRGARLNWAALARCESGGNPKSVNRSGRYRGAFQMDASFWLSYGGLAFASRPDLATYAQQLVVAQNGYAARGGSPWPYCRRFL